MTASIPRRATDSRSYACAASTSVAYRPRYLRCQSRLCDRGALHTDRMRSPLTCAARAQVRTWAGQVLNDMAVSIKIQMGKYALALPRQIIRE